MRTQKYKSCYIFLNYDFHVKVTLKPCIENSLAKLLYDFIIFCYIEESNEWVWLTFDWLRRSYNWSNKLVCLVRIFNSKESILCQMSERIRRVTTAHSLSILVLAPTCHALLRLFLFQSPSCLREGCVGHTFKEFNGLLSIHSNPLNFNLI